MLKLAIRLGVVVLLSSATSLYGTPTASESFSQLLHEHWEFRLREAPLFATSTGDSRYNGQLGTVSLAAAQRRDLRWAEFEDQVAGLLPQLSGDDLLNAKILQRLLDHQRQSFRFGEHWIPITNRSGFHISFPELSEQMSLQTVEDYRDYVSRLRAFRQYAREHIEIMRTGLEKGYSLPAIVLEGYREPLVANIVDDPEASRLFQPLRDFPQRISEAERRTLTDAARAAIEQSVVPGYRDFLKFMESEYVPMARGTVGASALPQGREYYRYCVRKFTTLDVLPDEVHAIGLQEVARIREEMQQIIRAVEFEGDFAEFLAFLRSDPQFYAADAETLLKETAMVLKSIDGKLPSLFRTLPRTPYGIKEIPAYIAPRTTTAYYQPPRGDGTAAGFYYVNTYNLSSRPLYGVEALSLHEAVPGHHLQIALQQELESLPAFRRYAGFTAFIEGWALYAERLGLEMGMFQDPYSDFGRLTYEMWRACRLVVDTGVHYFGWSRDQAIAFMEQNSALSKHNIRAEVDRYIAWPGQALGYKMGELKIRELRRMAEKELGSVFDVREFHDVVLLAGAVPLDVLESRVRAWIELSQADDDPR